MLHRFVKFYRRVIGFRVAEGWYRGDAKLGRPNGFGTLYYKSGAKYNGGFLNGLRQGFGKIEYRSGFSFEGIWQRGSAAGSGVIVYKNKNSYKGNVRGFLRCGQGSLYLKKSQSTVQANWKNDRIIGNFSIKASSFYFEGSFLTSDEYALKGSLADATEKDLLTFLKLNATGQFKFSDGTKVTGTWLNQDTAYNAHLTDHEGVVWEGKIHKNKPDGLVRALLPNGEIYDCFWVDGVQVRAFSGSIKNRRVYHYRN